MSVVLSLWRGLIEGPPAPPALMRDIAIEVAARHSLTLADLSGRSKRRHIAIARQEAMWEVWQATNYSFPRIGAFFKRDHTTVLHNVRVHAKRRAS